MRYLCLFTIFIPLPELIMLTWDPHLSVNIATIDEQHKKFIAMACELDRGMRADYATNILQPQFRDLLEFASLHFRTEEELMEHLFLPRTGNAPS